jgi:hypothetical protein
MMMICQNKTTLGEGNIHIKLGNTGNYRVSQKEVPHFKHLFYKNGKGYKTFHCNISKDI